MITGFYVDHTGKILEVKGVPTTNPLIVDLSDANLGLMVLGQQFFEDEKDATEQAKFNAEDTINQCEQTLNELDSWRKKKKPSTTTTTSKSRGFFTHRPKDEEDRFGPPDYGVGTKLKHIKRGYSGTLIGYSEKRDGTIEYNVKTSTQTYKIGRSGLDDYEVVE